MGPIAPAGWDRFFDFTGTPYAGPAYPQVDPARRRSQKFGAAEGEVRDEVPPGGALHGGGQRSRRLLPGKPGRLLPARRRGAAPPLFGQVAFQVMTGAGVGGALGMTVTEGPEGAGVPAHAHARTYEGIYVLDGR